MRPPQGQNDRLEHEPRPHDRTCSQMEAQLRSRPRVASRRSSRSAGAERNPARYRFAPLLTTRETAAPRLRTLCDFGLSAITLPALTLAEKT
jgi:hypothetical protein